MCGWLLPGLPFFVAEGRSAPQVVYELNRLLRPTSVSITDELWQLYRDWQANGKAPKESREAVNDHLKDGFKMIR
jgi:hypothetical protein